jgi:hypothetical protein
VQASGVLNIEQTSNEDISPAMRSFYEGNEIKGTIIPGVVQ